MSGLLRRIKRSRPADAGEPLPEGQAAAPEGAPTTAEPPVFGPAPPPVHGPEPAPAAAPAPATEAPVLLADPNVPAGVDPAAAPLRPPAGRRGRLRRRLRYLRRARELMLRDLGGLLYEVHRTGGGDVAAHATIVDAKVRRIAGLDQEAHALEAALASPRAETVLFQPGVGGTCGHCGALFPSEARFCAACGTSVDAAVAAPVTGEAAVAEPVTGEVAVAAARGRRFWQRRKVPPMPVSGEAAADAPAEDAPAEDATAVLTPTDAPADAAPAAEAPAEEQPAADAPAEQPADEQPAADAPAEQPGEKHSGMGNGRAEDHTPPDLSSGDPLVTRRTGT